MDKEQKRKEITSKILGAGGKVVHVVGSEEEMDMLLAKGQFFEGEVSIIEGGRPMSCHENSLQFYLENEDMKLCTGYAANKTSDNEYMWVKHSWCVDKDGIVHECTPEKRDKYFGAIMDEREAEKFRRKTDFAYDAECRRKEEAERTTRIEQRRKEVFEKLSRYSYEPALERFKNPENIDELGLIALEDAAKVIEACESGMKPQEAMNKLEIEKPSLVITVIAEVYKKGPELYETYIKDMGLEVTDLNPATQEMLSEMRERNATLEAEETRTNGFNETLSKVTTDEEYIDFIDNEDNAPSVISKDKIVPGEE